jgi:tRNA threonylcarbamoyladenosine biosynthesis protein TsaE
MQQEFILKSESDTIELAINIAAQIKKGSIVTFNGDLGSGKTFFCRHIIKFLCGSDTKVVSPTFNLLQIYQAKKFEIYHFDLYRLKHLEEIYELGIEEALAGHVCLIEWPSIIDNILPQDTISIKISTVNDTTRLAKISGINIKHLA